MTDVDENIPINMVFL